MHVSKGVSDKLQSEDLDVVNGCERVADLLTTLRGLRCEKEFDAFWANSITRCHDLNIPEPKEIRPHKLPRRIDDNPDTAVQFLPKDKFRVTFYYNVS
jgi:hypothetical protein